MTARPRTPAEPDAYQQLADDLGRALAAYLVAVLRQLQPPPVVVPETTAEPDRLPFPLRDREEAAYRVAPGPSEHPVTIKKLATLAGYSYTEHFREGVQNLVDRGYLERIRGGVRRRPRHP